MSTFVLRAMRCACVVVSVLVGSVATANAATDEKETTKKSWAVDASHGTYGDTIPIEVPAFRGITPELALRYDSSEGNSELGVGWTLDGVGVIERASPGKGAPKYDEDDVFLLEGQELVACAPGGVSPSCTSGGTHSTKVESYQRIALAGTGSDSRWTVTAKDGTRRVYAPVFVLNGGVYKWGLAQVIDTKDNAVTYRWSADELGCCWEQLESVSYNGTTVAFHYEARPDLELAAVGDGSMRTVHGRLQTIDITVSGSRLRAYALGYTESGATSRSLLSSVQQFGTDATLDGSGTVTGGTSLPAIAIDYQIGDPAFAPGSHDHRVVNDSDAKSFAIDINGDGMDDMLELYPSLTTMRRRTWISDGSGFTETSDEFGMSAASDTRFLPMDVDGDGMTDIVELFPSFLEWGVRTWISNGSGFDVASTQGTGRTFNAESRFLAMDIDGDGRSDMLELYGSWASYRRVSWISTGDGFIEGSDESGIRYDENSRFFAMDVDGDGMSDLVELFQSIGGFGRNIWLSHGSGFSAGASDSIVSGTDDQFIPMDINGDGKKDLLQIHPFASVNYLRAWLSTGDSFTLASDDPGAPFSSDNWYVAMDVNGDGKSDLVELDPYGLGVYRRQIWLSVGSGFVAGAHDLDIGFSDSTELMAADVDGDGLSEMIELYPAGLVKGRRVWSMNDRYPDLLASLTNGLGGTISVGYTPSSAWDNSNNPPLTQTATTVTTTDGRGGSATTYYEYAGGLHDRLEQRFLGFRYQLETLPCIDGESTCPYVETWFRQDYGAASKPERVDHRAGDGQLLRSEIHEYTTNGATVPWTSLPTGEWEYTYVESGEACPGEECKRTYSNRTFSEYGELAVEVDYGDYDVDGDERTLTTTFVPNTTAYIVSKPAEAKTFEGVGTDGALLEETLSYYDGATGWDRPPSAGLSTTTARWLSDPSSFVETHREYDDWGNVTAEINAVGARTESTFDADYHQFEIAKTNALGQTTTTTWDVVCGAPTQTQDLDGQATTMSYDALCRMTEKVEPGGMFERHAWVELGDAGKQYELVETPAADGTSNPMWTRTYFDGYRRTRRTVAPGPDAATGDIYLDTDYNARGQQASVTAAYYWVSGAAQPATFATASSYDALDRLTRVTHPDGAYATKTYGLWSVTDTDELGHAKADHFDADGKRVAHDEFIDGEIETTTYSYDARGHLAESTDPLGNVITYETDSLGRNTLIDDPDWGTWTYEYDGAGRLTAQTDAKEQRTELAYDALDRKISKTSRAGTDAAVTVSWTYDEVRDGYYNTGELTTMTDAAGSETFDHDVAGNVVKSVRTIDGASYAFEHGFDRGKRKLWTIYPDGDTLGTPSAPLSYDSAGRLASIPGYVEAARYDAGGKLTRLDNANGTVTAREHAAERGWLAAISTRSGEATIQDLAYTRDAKGMITRVTSPVANEGWSYEYDELDRLTAAINTSDSTYDQTLEYDAIGNVTWNSRLGEYAYETSRPHAAIAAGSNSYDYDAAGLMTSGAGRALTWDGDNRVAAVTAPRTDGDPDEDDADDGGDATAACGTVGGRGFPAWGWLVLGLLVCSSRRRRATRPTWVVCGLALAIACTGGRHGAPSDDAPSPTDGTPDTDPDAEGNTTITFTYDANGARIQQVEGAITRRHLGDGYELEVGGSTIKYVSLAGSIVARKLGDEKMWVHVDHLGSIQAATDEAGDEVLRKAYRPYGEMLATDGTLELEPRGFTGQRHDASGLVYLHARYYDPALSRFISPDTIIAGSDNFGLNRYAYASNDPVNKTDIDGYSPKDPDKADDAAKKAFQLLKKGATFVGRVAGTIATAYVITTSGAQANAGPVEHDMKQVQKVVECGARCNRGQNPLPTKNPTLSPNELKPVYSVNGPPVSPKTGLVRWGVKLGARGASRIPYVGVLAIGGLAAWEGHDADQSYVARQRAAGSEPKTWARATIASSVGTASVMDSLPIGGDILGATGDLFRQIPRIVELFD